MKMGLPDDLGHVSIKTRDNFLIHFSDVTVRNLVAHNNVTTSSKFNHNNSNNLVRRFMCNVLPHANRTCASADVEEERDKG
mmetsp:Transcript_31271/g.45678  ORF Transcript_31271/g.45678 Transcript_31271/m.45678 type:complete len:81 (-) Transcript_31271:1706-1948(-)